jgi:hypothetical protein
MTSTVSGVKASPSSTSGLAAPVLLDDAQVMRFVNRGYHLVETDFPAEFHQRVIRELEAKPDRYGNGVLDTVPDLQKVYDHPKVRGALISLLGDDMRMNEHRHCHAIAPRTMTSQSWHQDGTNVRHHQVWTVLAMYYPQDVTPEMGPTVILPGSHFRNAPTDRMANYTNILGAEFLTVKAGTVAITHYDLWHAGTLNRSDRARYMLKFLFDRQSPPGRPSWKHDPVSGGRVAQGLVSEMIGPVQHYVSDYYKEWELRKEMWAWLNGRSEPVPPGAFKSLLSSQAEF